MLIAALAYTLHLISFPAGWSTPQWSETIFNRPSFATMGENGTAAAILAQWSQKSQTYPAQRILIHRSDGTTTYLQAFGAFKMQPFLFHENLADCMQDTRNCAWFSTVALARDGTTFVTLEEGFSGAYSGRRKAALVWDGAWHVISAGTTLHGVARPMDPRNLAIAAADTPQDYAFIGGYSDLFPMEDLNDAGRDPLWMADVSGASFYWGHVRLGIGDVTAMRGR